MRRKSSINEILLQLEFSHVVSVCEFSNFGKTLLRLYWILFPNLRGFFVKNSYLQFFMPLYLRFSRFFPRKCFFKWWNKKKANNLSLSILKFGGSKLWNKSMAAFSQFHFFPKSVTRTNSIVDGKSKARQNEVFNFVQFLRIFMRLITARNWLPLTHKSYSSKEIVFPQTEALDIDKTIEASFTY